MAKTSLGTSVYGPDPSYVEGLSNIASMFDPKAQAAGALTQAHTDYYGHQAALADAQARLNAAKAAGVEDTNAAYADEAAMTAAGFTPAQRLYYRMARSNNPEQMANARVVDNAGQDLQSPNVDIQRRGAIGLRAPGSMGVSSVFNANQSNQIASRDTANTIAIEQGRLHNVGQGQIAYTIQNGKVVPLISGNVDLAPGHTYYSNQGGVLTQSAQSPVATGSATDPVKEAASEQALIGKMNNSIIAATSTLDSTGKAYAATPPLEQVNSVSELALKLLKSRQATSYADALNQAAIAHGIKLNQQALVAEKAPGTLWGENPTGRHLLSGFHSPNGIADIVAPQINQTSPAGSIVPEQNQPTQNQPTENKPENSIIPTANGGLNVNGVSYIPGNKASSEMVNGQATHAINKKTGDSMVVYWNQGTGKYQTKPVFKGNENTGDFESMRGNNNILGVIPMKDASTAAKNVAEKALSLGVITQEQLNAAMQADQSSGKNETNVGYGSNVQKLLLESQDKIIAAQRIKASQDPRIAQYAAGNFPDAGNNSLPSDAMALAEKAGINRAEWGIPESGWGEGLPMGLGALFAPGGYGPAKEAMRANLPAFFKAIQEGRIDPNTLSVNQSIVPQVASSK